MRLLTLRRILVASDLEESSLPALHTAAELASLAGAELHLLHVAEKEPAAAEVLLREQARQACGASQLSSVRVATGSAATGVVEHAHGIGADVIVVGPHRRRGEERGGLGSTATRIVQNASSPCLIATEVLRLPLERVMVPTDLSEAARGALAVAVSWGLALRPPRSEAELIALHVLPRDPDPEVAAEVRREVEQVRARAGRAAAVRVREMVVTAEDPAREIVQRAAESLADLVVMGTSGAAGAASRFGSVSAGVARATPRPLLLVPPVVWKEMGEE